MVNVHFFVLGPAGNEVLFSSAKAAMDDAESLSDTFKFADEDTRFYVPHMNPLIGDIEQGIAVHVIEREAHDAMILLDQGEIGEIIKVIRSNSVVSVGGENGLAVLCVLETDHADPFP